MTIIEIKERSKETCICKVYYANFGTYFLARKSRLPFIRNDRTQWSVCLKKLLQSRFQFYRSRILSNWPILSPVSNFYSISRFASIVSTTYFPFDSIIILVNAYIARFAENLLLNHLSIIEVRCNRQRTT